MDLAPVAVPLRREHHADRDGLIPAAGRTAARLRRRAGPVRVHPARSGPGWPVPRGLCRPRAASAEANSAARWAAVARLSMPTWRKALSYRADPVQADFLRRLATRLEVLVQPPVPR